MSQAHIVIRKHLNADALFTTIHTEFEKIPEHRLGEVKISLADALMAGFAMFSLKDPSLLQFDKRRKDQAKRGNLVRIYQLDEIPCDSQMREILDEVVPDKLGPVYTTMFRQLQRGNVLKKMVFLDRISKRVSSSKKESSRHFMQVSSLDMEAFLPLLRWQKRLVNPRL